MIINLHLLMLPYIHGNGLLNLGPECILRPHLGIVVIDGNGLMFKSSILSQQLLSYIPFLLTRTVSFRQWISAQIKEFMDHNGIEHILTSFCHPSSNGLAERAVQMFKSRVSNLKGPLLPLASNIKEECYVVWTPCEWNQNIVFNHLFARAYSVQLIQLFTSYAPCVVSYLVICLGAY